MPLPYRPPVRSAGASPPMPNGIGKGDMCDRPVQEGRVGLVGRRIVPVPFVRRPLVSDFNLLFVSRAVFRMQPTRWTLIQRAGRDDVEGRRALEELCGIYWPGVYQFLRLKCGQAESARDLTQGFFLDLLSRGDIARVEQGKGRFRSFLFKASQNFAAKERASVSALKRGGGRLPVSLSDLDPDGLPEPVDSETPEKAYDRAWAQALVNQALKRLREEHDRRGRLEIFEALLPVLEMEGPEGGYKALAKALGKSEGALKVTVFRMKERFRELLLLEVGQTLSEGEDPLQELQELLSALSC